MGEGKNMKKFAIVLATATFIALMILTMFPIGTVKAQPRSNLDIIWYTSPESAFTALVNDEVDMIQWALTKEQREAVEANPDLQISAYTENGMFEFDFNNNMTIMDYPNSTNPMYFEDFRRAIACVIDKNYIISQILEYYGSRIDAPVAYPQTEGWVNESVVTYDWNHNGVIDPEEANYPWEYNMTKAVLLLAGMGFADTDDNGYLNYPDDPVWGDAAGIDTTQMPLKICIRQLHTHRREAGRYLYSQLEGDPAEAGDSPLADEWARLYAEGKVSAPGGDFDTTDEAYNQPREVLSPIVFADRNYISTRADGVSEDSQPICSSYTTVGSGTHGDPTTSTPMGNSTTT